MNNNLKFGKVLYAIREFRKMSLREFGSRVGLSAVYITDLENNRRKVTKAVYDTVKNNICLLPDEAEALDKAFYHDRASLPEDILYYLVDNNLIESLEVYRNLDSNGDVLRENAKALLDQNKRTMSK